MPRSKVKRMTAATTLINLKKVEKDFLATPSKLVKQLNKEILTHRKKEKALKKETAKNKLQIKTAETRMKSVANTAAGKKQLKTAKKTYQQALKAQAGLDKQLVKIAKTLEALGNTQTKLTALGKHLKQFNKEWLTKSKSPLKTTLRTKKLKSQTPPLSAPEETVYFKDAALEVETSETDETADAFTR